MSNREMDPTQRTEERLTELEIKASFADDLLEQLNKTIYEQQQQIDQLAQAIVQLRQQLPRPGDADNAGQSRDLREDIPPHY